jgi:hypothetical protein
MLHGLGTAAESAIYPRAMDQFAASHAMASARGVADFHAAANYHHAAAAAAMGHMGSGSGGSPSPHAPRRSRYSLLPIHASASQAGVQLSVGRA